MWSSLCRIGPRPKYHRQRLELSDGDFLDIDWAQPIQELDAPLVLILHGLEGSSDSSYVRGLVNVLQHRRMQCVVMHFRGCSGEPNRLPRTYHSGESTDLDQVIRWLAHHYPQRALAVVGYSLGGNVLLKWLGERGDQATIAAAAAVSVPMQLEICATRMERGFSRVYLWRLVRDLRGKIMRKFANRPCDLELEQVAKSRGFWSFDEHVTARLHGFSGAADYYQQSSSRQFLRHIAKPTLIVHARDDPFMTPAVLPRPDELPASVSLQVSAKGGHVGFISATGPLGLVPHYWLENRIANYLAKQLR